MINTATVAGSRRDMRLDMDMLETKKQNWAEKWFEAVIATYPAESVPFFRDTSDPFSNPVGATLKRATSEILDALMQDPMDPDAVYDALLPVVKLRAVQDFKPSSALGFLYDIKAIVGSDARKVGKELSSIFDLISRNLEQAMLVAFDIYMDCKTKVFELRARQARDQVGKLLVKKGLVAELPEHGIPVITLNARHKGRL